MIEAEPGACVQVGFKDAVELATVREWMRTQDSAAMLAAMHELPVARRRRDLRPGRHAARDRRRAS